MPLPRKIPFALLTSLLFMFSALEFASAQCAIKPIKPIPPLGCKDVTPQCVSTSNGQSSWTWICVPDSGGADANKGWARQAPTPERAIPRAADQNAVPAAPVNPVAMVAPQTHVPISEDSKPAVETLQMIAQRIGECPKALDGEIQWGRKKYEIVRTYQESPVNLVWDVVAGNSVRAPYLGYVEFTVDESYWVSESEKRSFLKWPGAAFYLKWVVGPWHYRYEYDLGPNGLQLTRVLSRSPNRTTGEWAEPTGNAFAKHCWDTAARDTQAKANALHDQSVPQDDSQAAMWFRKTAEQGNAEAQNILGGLYYQGQGVPQDYTQAALWYRKAAEQGFALAQNNLGMLYDYGQGVAQDHSQAAMWFRKAAEQGNAEAQWSLGTLYEYGQGVPRDYTQAAVWWRKAAEQGHTSAQYLLALLYYTGQGVSQDYSQAALWYRKAAEQGDAAAQLSLGSQYGLGQGVSQDYAEAYFWLDLAATGKRDGKEMETAAKIRDEAASHLTPADLARAQERVRKWFEDHPAKPQ
jgi:TPR repeat protein